MFDWNDFLKLAQELVSASKDPTYDEAKLRSSVSRAYYSVFCQARNHLQYRDGIVLTKSGDVHRRVADEFLYSRDKNRKRIGETLHTMRSDRNKSDYDNTVSNPAKMAEKNLHKAQQILNLLSKL